MRIFLTFCLSLLLPAIALGQWDGDECSYAIQGFEGSMPFSTWGASPSTPIPDDAMCSGTYLGWDGTTSDIWFAFTPSQTGDYHITTCDLESFDTSLVLYQGLCDSLTQIACNGDADDAKTSCQSFYSAINYTLNYGQQYFVRVGGFGSEVGDGTLTIQLASGGNNTIWYVDKEAGGSGSGTSWADAFMHLQDALDVASSGDQIWIAEGTYVVNDRLDTSDPRDSSFRMLSGVEVYGGFQGTETSVDERNPSEYPVILSGDIDGDDSTAGGDTSENAYHVVTFDGTFSRPLIDGLHIVGGNADTKKSPYGGGIYITNLDDNSSVYPAINNCFVLNNEAEIGGGIAIESGGADITRTIIARNKALARAGGIITAGELWLDNCLVTGNIAAGNVGAISIQSAGTSTINNTTITQNSGERFGGIQVFVGTLEVTNTLLWGNRSINGDTSEQINVGSMGTLVSNYNCIEFIGDQSPGTGNLGVNPRFLDEFGPDNIPGTGDERFQLLQQSPLIDAGDNSEVNSPIDLNGNNRQIDDPYTADTGNGDDGYPIVDIGALEHRPESNNIGIWTGNNSDDFNDPENWLPGEQPNGEWSALLNTTGSRFIAFSQPTYINRMFVTSGDITFDLTKQSLQILSNYEPLRIGTYGETASATFKGPSGGYISIPGGVILEDGNLSFGQGITADIGELNISNGCSLRFDGSLYGTLINNGGKIKPGGVSAAGQFNINGDLNSKNQPNTNFVGSIAFDVTNNQQYDNIAITGSMYDKISLEIKWDPFYKPAEGESYDILDVGYYGANTTLIYASGLPRGLTCRWNPPTNGLRGGDDVIVETEGPIEFDDPISMVLANSPNDIAVVDVDGINGPDVAMTFSNDAGGNGTVIVYLNNGVTDSWQGFTEQTPITVGNTPLDIKAADFNGDGTANDLVVANYDDHTVSVLMNDGSGIFTTTDFGTDNNPKVIAIGDYVEDGNDLVDIVAACDSGDATVLQNTTSLGARGVTFSNVNSIGIPTPTDIDPGDVNDDKDLDFILLNDSSDSIRVLDGTGTGSTPLGMVFDDALVTGSDATELEFADLNNDGFDDAITVNFGNGTMSVLQGDGNELGAVSSFSVGTEPESMSAADFDNDGDEDLVVSVIGDISSERELQVIRNDSSTTILLVADQIAGSSYSPEMVEYGDFDADGLLDIVSIIEMAPLGMHDSPGIGVFLNSTTVVVDCLGDVDSNGAVEVADILEIISAWGTSNTACDLDESGVVDVADLLIVVANWGPCE